MKKAVNAQLKHIRGLLKEKQTRDASDVFVAEGLKTVRDIAAKGHAIDSVLVSDSFAENKGNRILLEHFDKRGAALFQTADTGFKKTSSLMHPEGILVLVKKIPLKHAALDKKTALIVLCDGIQDPGNLGAIIRTSAAFGADQLILTGESVDAYNPKVVRSSSGTILDIPISSFQYCEIDRLRKAGYCLYASQINVKKGMDISKIKNISLRSIIAFGSEGKGLSDEICRRADEFFYIPIAENVESLNVTATAAISLYAFGKMNFC